MTTLTCLHFPRNVHENYNTYNYNKQCFEGQLLFSQVDRPGLGQHQTSVVVQQPRNAMFAGAGYQSAQEPSQTSKKPI